MGSPDLALSLQHRKIAPRRRGGDAKLFLQPGNRNASRSLDKLRYTLLPLLWNHDYFSSFRDHLSNYSAKLLKALHHLHTTVAGDAY
jgi:hypothetical protein